ncbi:MAG: hypothetical protein ACI4JY_05395 [Oscillospiraceae bacterium]
MIQLADGRTELWQWDTGRIISVDEPCTQVHFSNKIYGHSLNVDVTDRTAKIPDELLQSCADLKCWAFVGSAEDGYTRLEKIFKINRRNKPADYVFTPTEQKTLKSIQDQIGDLADLDTKAKNNLVAAINEARKSGGGAVDVTAEDVSYTHEDEKWVNVKEALDGYYTYLLSYDESINELANIAHTHYNKPVLDELSAADGKLQYAGSDVGLKGDKGDKGEPGADGYTPVKGTDYWTEEDKAEIVDDVLAALPTWTGGSY